MKGNDILWCIKCNTDDGLLHGLFPPSFSSVEECFVLHSWRRTVFTFGCYLDRVRKSKSVGKNPKESNQNTYAIWYLWQYFAVDPQCYISFPAEIVQAFLLCNWLFLLECSTLHLLPVVLHPVSFSLFYVYIFFISQVYFKFKFCPVLIKCLYLLIATVDVVYKMYQRSYERK